MPPPSIVIHERLGTWARQLRPRFGPDSIRWSESRTVDELTRVASEGPCPILVVDLGDRPEPGLRALIAGLAVAPQALSLVLDPNPGPDFAGLARDLGATLVLSGPVVPPRVVSLLHRWIPLAARRSEAAGWSPARPSDVTD